MNLFNKLLLIIIFFFSSNVWCELGISQKNTEVLFLFVFFIKFIFGKKTIGKNVTESYFIIITFILYGIYKMYSDTSEGIKVLVLVLILPVVIFGGLTHYDPFKNRNTLFWVNLSHIIYVFYLAECGLAIIERIIGYNFFDCGIIEMTEMEGGHDNSFFRSFALMGHPLQNALIVSTIMSFILISDLNIKFKSILWAVGYLAILSFNTRSSILGNILILVMYVGYEMYCSNHYNRKQKSGIFLILILFLAIGYLLVFVYGFGGRLSSMGLFDETSAQTRVDVWGVFEVLPLSSFLYGFDFETTEFIKFMAGIKYTENFWIDYILRFGLVFIAIYIILYYRLLKKLYYGYSYVQIFITASTFILIASTNNSLSTVWHPILIYLVCIVLFNPHNAYIQWKK